MAFKDEFSLPYSVDLIFSALPGYSFILDMIVCCFTSYYDKGVLVENRLQVIKNYLKNGFFWDSIVVSSFIIG